MKNRSDSVFRLAFAAIAAGASVAILWLGAVTGLFDLSAILIAGAITVVVRIESGERYAWAAVAVVTVLSLVFLPDKLLALGYFAVAGAYPLLCRFLPQRGAAMWITRA
ncbi:MAG: hypothetical protein II836_05320, partial [Clostridia bacterium]|nr:hypothetical protein [Clostridia bacterium]